MLLSNPIETASVILSSQVCGPLKSEEKNVYCSFQSCSAFSIGLVMINIVKKKVPKYWFYFSKMSWHLNIVLGGLFTQSISCYSQSKHFQMAQIISGWGYLRVSFKLSVAFWTPAFFLHVTFVAWMSNKKVTRAASHLVLVKSRPT